MLKNGFTRFCDDPEIACCKAERELEQLRAENASLQNQLSKSQSREQVVMQLAGKLIALCDMPEEWRDKLLRRHMNRPGDYMGCGYDFLDTFNRIFDEFTESTDDETYQAVRISAEYEIEKWRGPQEHKKRVSPP